MKVCNFLFCAALMGLIFREEAGPGLVSHVAVDKELLEFRSYLDSIQAVTKRIATVIIGKGSTCRVLDFGYWMDNFVVDDSLKQIVKLCRVLPDLEVLNFAYNRIGDRGLQESLLPLLGHEKLKYIVLKGNCITLAGIQGLLKLLEEGVFYPDPYGNLQRLPAECPALDSGKAIELACKVIWVPKSDIDALKSAGAISSQSAVAHWNYYALANPEYL